LTWKQLVAPRLDVSEQAGWCLRFVQSVYNAPAKYDSAHNSWLGTKDKHTDRSMPNVSVPVWFDYWATLDSSGNKNWGHVVAWIPSSGFLSSPGSGVGSRWFSSIEAVEAYFKAKFVGWSTDINGLTVATDSGSQSINRTEEENMAVIARMEDSGAAYLWNMSTGKYQSLDFPQFGIFSKALTVMPFANAKEFDYIRTGFSSTLIIGIDNSTIAAAVASSVGKVNVNVDAIASAISMKLGVSVDAPTNKAEIIAAIESNYPEGK
jgi:hypothetical protein